MNFEYAIQVADNFIAPQEGFVASPYWDVNGYAIGFGNHYYEDGTSVTQDDDPITRSRGMQLLDFVVRQKANAILPYITAALNENQFAALVSLAYNCGEGNVRSSTLLQMINAGASPDDISAQYAKTCVTAKGVYMSDLYNRRVDEAGLFFSVVTQYVKENPIKVYVSIGLLVALGGFLIYKFAIKK